MTQALQTTPETLSLADEEWGYEFGCEGLMTTDSVKTFLDVSRWTLDKFTREKLIRKSSGRGERVYFCRRSIREFIRNNNREV